MLPPVPASRQDELWKLFETRMCGISTGAFLSDPELVALIAPLTKTHATDEAEKLRATLTRPSEPPHPAFSPRIALTNAHLDGLGGSEFWTFDVARRFQELGLPLIVFSPVLGEMASRMRRHGIRTTDVVGDVVAFAPDILHVNHFAAVASLRDALRGRAKVVNMLHGLLPALGLPGREGVDAYSTIGLHAQAKGHLLTGRPWSDFPISPNFYDPQRFRRAREAAPARALLFSSKTEPKQREHLRSLVSAAGYELDHIGYGGIPAEAPEEVLPHYDLVFAVARSAVEAMAAGGKLILWDDGVMGPAVTAENFWMCVASNFSMASCVLPFVNIKDDDAGTWIAANISAVREDRGGASDLTRAHLTIENTTADLLRRYRIASASD